MENNLEGLKKMITSSDYNIFEEGCRLIENLYTELTEEDKIKFIDECCNIFKTDEETYGKHAVRFIFTEVALLKDNYKFKNLI